MRSSMLLLAVAAASFSYAAPAKAPLAKRDSGSYQLYFWDANAKRLGSDINGNMWNDCVEPPTGTTQFTGGVNNMCIDVFSDQACTKKVGTLGSEYGHCSDGNISLQGSPSGAGLGQPYGGASPPSYSLSGAFAGEKRSLAELLRRGGPALVGSYRGSVP